MGEASLEGTVLSLPPDLLDPRLRRSLTAIAIQNRSGYYRHRKSPPAAPIFLVQPGRLNMCILFPALAGLLGMQTHGKMDNVPFFQPCGGWKMMHKLFMHWLLRSFGVRCLPVKPYP